jgi:transcriptional regulator of acetoin/glycerol metabolism
MGASLLVSRQAAERLPVCVVGEPGVGKEVTVRAVASHHFPNRNLVVIDAVETPLNGPEVVASVLGDLGHGSPVLVKHAEMLPDGVLTTLLSAVTAGRDTLTGWLALSLRTSASGETGPAADELRAAGVLLAAVPPLRARPQDLEKIVPAMVRRHAGRRDLSLTPALLSRLMHEPWPGNLIEVDALVRQMVAGARGEALDMADLPGKLRTTNRRQLTTMEWMTRDAIVTALRTHDGDKAQAAASLGMSRASIYRKIKSFGIQADEQRSHPGT